MKPILITTAITALLASLSVHAAAAEGPLLQAARANDIARVQHLLDHGADIDATSPTGNTALIYAAAHGYSELAQLLVDRGADLDARGYIGNTALIYAAQEGHAEIVRLLVEHGADAEARNEYGSSAPNLAVGYGHRDVARTLEQERTVPWLNGDGLVQQLAYLLLAIAAIVSVPALAARAIYASVTTTRSHLVK
jgi:ankyrin repeat protein